MLVFEFEGIFLKLKGEVLFKMFQFIQDDKTKSEAGGILLGYYIDQNNFSVTDISVPSPKDKRSRYNFYRSKLGGQKVVNRFFQKSKGKKIYLGEWHTHPEYYPNPSALDRKSIMGQMKNGRLNSDKIFSIILGEKGFHLSLVTSKGIVSEISISFQDLTSELKIK